MQKEVFSKFVTFNKFASNLRKTKATDLDGANINFYDFNFCYYCYFKSIATIINRRATILKHCTNHTLVDTALQKELLAGI